MFSDRSADEVIASHSANQEETIKYQPPPRVIGSTTGSSSSTGLKVVSYFLYFNSLQVAMAIPHKEPYEEFNCKTDSVHIDMFLILFSLKSMKRLEFITFWFSLYPIAEKSIKIFFMKLDYAGKK